MVSAEELRTDEHHTQTCVLVSFGWLLAASRVRHVGYTVAAEWIRLVARVVLF
jgi:hypothetical protein